MIKIRPKEVTLLLSTTAVFIVLAHCMSMFAKTAGHDYLGGLVPLFDMDREKNIPTFFSILLAMIASGLLCVITLAKRQSSRPWKLWAGLAAIFLLVAIDDFVGVHEQLSRPMRDMLNARGLLYFAWIIPYSLFVMLLAGVYSRFVFNMPIRIRNGLLLSATLFLSGAIGFEMLGARLFDYSNLNKTLIYSAMTTVEESLELAGMIVFIHALMSYIEEVQRNILLQLGAHDPLAEIVAEIKPLPQSLLGLDNSN